MRRTDLSTVLLLLACTCLHRTWAAASATSDITGKVVSPAMASTSVILYTSTGQKRIAYPDDEGTFTFEDVPLGTHLLQPFHPAMYYPEVQVDLGKSGVYRAQYIAQGGGTGSVSQPVVVPLSLRYAGEMMYYEKRKPVDVWSFVKSPYGLMIAFSLFIIVVMPRLKVDPEDLKQLQSELKGDGKAAAAAGASGGSQQRIANR